MEENVPPFLLSSCFFISSLIFVSACSFIVWSLLMFCKSPSFWFSAALLLFGAVLMTWFSVGLRMLPLLALKLLPQWLGVVKAGPPCVSWLTCSDGWVRVSSVHYIDEVYCNFWSIFVSCFETTRSFRDAPLNCWNTFFWSQVDIIGSQSLSILGHGLIKGLCSAVRCRGIVGCLSSSISLWRPLIRPSIFWRDCCTLPVADKSLRISMTWL